jgi:DNA/RNA-binding domain of Phe-tRNA-synthetase-like protein
MRSVSVDSKIFTEFPAARIGLLVISGMNNSGGSGFIPLLQAEEARQKELLATTELPSLPEIKVWRDAYKKFGSDPRDFRSSIEALLRRARGGSKPLPHINDLVDLYNYISIKYHVPVGAEDLTKIKGEVRLAFADGSEHGLALGAQAPENCYPGEVIYRDDEGFLCRRWNWREADRTKIESTTKDAILVIDTVGGIAPEVLEQSLDETETLIKEKLSGRTQRCILEPSRLRFDF